MSDLVYVSVREGKFNLLDPEEKGYSTKIGNLPDEAPAEYISVVLDYDLSGAPPSVVAEELRDYYDSVISTSKEEHLEILDWIDENKQLVDKQYAKHKIQKKRNKVESLKKQIDRLRSRYNL